MRLQLLVTRTSLLFIFVALTAMSVLAQANAVHPLVTQPVDLYNLVTLHGNIHPLARPEFDQGVAPDDLPMERMLLVLQRSPDQEAALRQLLDDQQVKSSPQFHQWLTPEQFGRQFGPADSDLQAVTRWLTSQGFQVAKVSTGRTVVEFSGSAGLVRQVLGAEIHRFRVNGIDYWANTTDPQIPAALAPVVAGFASLNSFPRHSGSHIVDAYSKSTQTGVIQPLFTVPTSSTTTIYGVAPYDFATIYNVLPLWNAGIDGTGQTIAIVAESNINYSDVESFQNIFGLPVNPINEILNGPDPGIVQSEETEALLDVSWSGAVAKGATIDMVISQTTETTQGIDLSALYIVDNDLAPVLSESYGECEANLGAGGNAFQYAIREQAAAEGITYINSSGDAGSARCDQGLSEYAASNGLAISGLASTPFNVAVGGTDFGDKNNWGAYWNSTNSSNNASAKSYIPETTWNASCASSGATSSCSNAANDTPEGIDFLAAGGGPSNCGVWSGTGSTATCLSGYPKPAWQSGAGVPQDGVRDIPDVSLFASTGTNGSFYVLCEGDAVQGNPSCSGGSNWYFIGVGGTSAAAPSFAGIMALVNQKTGERQGNANYVLYPLAAQSGASCTSNTAAISNANCIFYDVVSGNNSVACSGGSQNCSNKSSGGYGILVNPDNSSLPAWATGTGYDLATGLGTLNVANLVNKWSSVTFQSTTTTLSSLPATVVHGQPASFKVTVTSGSGTPTGDVSLIAQTSSTQSTGIGSFTLSNGGTFSSSTDMLPGGSYNVIAHYAGDGVHGASDSAPQPVTVAKENSQTKVQITSCDYTSGVCASGAGSGVYGSSYTVLRTDVTNAGGLPCTSATTELLTYPCPSGTVAVTVNGGAPFDPGNPSSGSGAYILNSQGYAEDQYIQLPGGSYNILASYAGDNSYNSSTSPPLPITLSKAATTTTITGVPSSQYLIAGNEVAISVTVTTTSHGIAPPSSVLIFNGSTSLGGGGDYNETNGSATGFASVAASVTIILPSGNVSLTAQYPGDNFYAPSTSAPVNIKVADFALTSTPSSLNVSAAGQSTTATITATSQGGFSGTVNLQATGCPTGGTCTFSPASVSVTGTTPGQSVLTITTTAPSSGAPTAVRQRGPRSPVIKVDSRWLLLALLILGMLLSMVTSRRRAVAGLFVSSLLLVGIWAACGGGSVGGGGGGGGGSSPTPPPAPAGGLSPTALTFNQQAMGTPSVAQFVQLFNDGNASMTVSGLALGGTNAGDFSQTNNCGATLAPGSDCAISVTFMPTAMGTRNATLSATDNAAGSPHITTLSGTGAQQVINLSPSGLTFGKVIEYNQSPPQTVTLTNATSSAVTFDYLDVVGQYFWKSADTCSAGLAANSTCTVSVYFQPSMPGTFAATLQITLSGSSIREGVDMTGTGVLPATPPGSYTLGVIGTSGMDRHVLNVPLTVQ